MNKKATYLSRPTIGIAQLAGNIVSFRSLGLFMLMCPTVFGPVHLAYNPSYSACFFQPEQYLSLTKNQPTMFFNQLIIPAERALCRKLVFTQHLQISWQEVFEILNAMQEDAKHIREVLTYYLCTHEENQFLLRAIRDIAEQHVKFHIAPMVLCLCLKESLSLHLF
jgi:hypothetical protein